jgi:hypothetical protein
MKNTITLLILETYENPVRMIHSVQWKRMFLRHYVARHEQEKVLLKNIGEKFLGGYLVSNVSDLEAKPFIVYIIQTVDGMLLLNKPTVFTQFREPAFKHVTMSTEVSGKYIVIHPDTFYSTTNYSRRRIANQKLIVTNHKI